MHCTHDLDTPSRGAVTRHFSKIFVCLLFTLVPFSSFGIDVACLLNIEPVVNPIRFCNTGESKVRIVCDRDLSSKATVTKAAINRESHWFDLNKVRISENQIDLGVDLRAIARSGQNELEVHFRGVEPTIQRFSFVADYAPPVIRLTTNRTGTKVDLFDGQSAINEAVVVARLQNGDFVTSRLEDIGEPYDRGRWSERQISFIVDPTHGKNTMILASDKGGNSAASMLDGSAVAPFREEHMRFIRLKRKFAVAEASQTSMQSLADRNSDYAFRLALVYVHGNIPTPILAQRMARLRESMETLVDFFDDELWLNRLEIPGFKERSRDNLVYYTRALGSSFAQRVDVGTTSSPALITLERVELGIADPFGKNIEREVTPGNASFCELNEMAQVPDFHQKLLADARDARAWGEPRLNERLVVVFDRFAQPNLLGFYRYYDRIDSPPIPSVYIRRTDMSSEGFAEFPASLISSVIAHELGHSFGLSHVGGIFDLGFKGNHPRVVERSLATATQNLMFHKAGASNYLSVAQLRRILFYNFGSPTDAALPLPINGEFRDFVTGTEQFFDREITGRGQVRTPLILGPFGVRSEMPELPNIEGRKFPLLLSTLPQSAQDMSLNNTIYDSVPWTASHLENPNNFIAYMPGGLNGIDPRTGRLLKPPSVTQDSWEIKSGVKQIEVGLIPLGIVGKEGIDVYRNGFFSPSRNPIEDGTALEKLRSWAQKTGFRVSNFELPVRYSHGSTLHLRSSFDQFSTKLEFSVSGRGQTQDLCEDSNCILVHSDRIGGREQAFALLLRKDQVEPLLGSYYLREK